MTTDVEAARLLVAGDAIDPASIMRGLEAAALRARCDHAATAVELAAKLDSGPYDCAIVDDRDAARTCALVAAVRDAAPAMPVLVVAAGDADAEEAAMTAGATDLLGRDDLAPVRLSRRLRFLLRVVRAEAHAEELLARAQASAAAREEVLGVVAHDLRSPLNAISLACEALADDVTADQRKRYVAAIRRAAMRAERLLRDLLDVSQIEGGGLRLELRPISVGAMLEQARADHELATRDARVDLTVDVAADAATALADRDRVLQVLSNLIGNAIKHAAGKPAVLTARAADGDGDGDWIEIALVDRGPGIKPQLLPYVFDRFWQARPHSRSGAGLGLAIARGIVEAHGGTITAANDPDGGARFAFRLRRAP